MCKKCTIHQVYYTYHLWLQRSAILPNRWWARHKATRAICCLKGYSNKSLRIFVLLYTSLTSLSLKRLSAKYLTHRNSNVSRDSILYSVQAYHIQPNLKGANSKTETVSTFEKPRISPIHSNSKKKWINRIILEIRPCTKQPISFSNQKGMKGQKKYGVKRRRTLSWWERSMSMLRGSGSTVFRHNKPDTATLVLLGKACFTSRVVGG